MPAHPLTNFKNILKVNLNLMILVQEIIHLRNGHDFHRKFKNSKSHTFLKKY